MLLRLRESFGSLVVCTSGSSDISC
jgi:hypothetical protein